MLVIGNEILSGRTRDLNLAHMADRLGARGIRLMEARFVSDQEEHIVDAVNALRHTYDLVFTSGGIGPTHDDITADSVARAFGVAIDVNPEARERLADECERRGVELTTDSLRMARIPDGARLIDNPVSAAPGFIIGNVHVMAGVPSILKAMLETLLPALPQGPVVESATVTVLDTGESRLATPLRELQARWPAVDIGSYPGRRDGRSRVELVARSSDPDMLASVYAALRDMAAEVAACCGGAIEE